MVSVGDVIEIEYVKEDLEQSFFGDYYGRRETFRSTIPVEEKVFILRVPASREFYFHARNLDVEPTREPSEDGELITHTWVAKNVAKLDAEPAMPPAKEALPVLEISTFEDWAAFSSWYHNLIKRQFESSPEIEAKVRELTSGATTDLEKIRAIYNFVVTDIRYNAWEFGVHGFKPYNASAVFARRFGDCKDKSTLMTVMLEHVGIPSEPVLIYADQRRGDEDLTLPMVHHFNHCITHIPAGAEHPELYLDGTASFHSLEELPSMDRGARVLVVEESDATIHRIPWNGPEDLGVEEDWSAIVADDGSANVTLRLRAQGDYGVFLRSNFEVVGRRKDELEQALSRRFAGATVTEQSFSDLADLDTPVSMTVRFHIPRFVVDSPEGPTIALPDDFFGSTRTLGGLSGLEERRFDLLLGNPRRSILRVSIELPSALEVRSLPEKRDLSARFGRFLLRWTPEESRIRFERRLELTASRVPVADYASFRELAASVERLRDEKILLKRN